MAGWLADFLNIHYPDPAGQVNHKTSVLLFPCQLVLTLGLAAPGGGSRGPGQGEGCWAVGGRGAEGLGGQTKEGIMAE